VTHNPSLSVFTPATTTFTPLPARKRFPMAISNNTLLSRRTLLRGSGVAIALPWLECMSPLSKSVVNAGGISAAERPKRAIFCMWGLGVNGRDFTPKKFGKDWDVTPILKPLEHLRDEFTIVSGLKLTFSGGHVGDRTFLTGTNTRGGGGAKFRGSCDQELAEMIGKDTRFPSLVLGIRRGTGFGTSVDHTLSWTKFGTPLPAENRPDVIFDRLFRAETPEQVTARKADAGRRGSILDLVDASAKRLNSKLGTNDRQKLDEYFTSIRLVEQQMQTDLEWMAKPRPKVEPIDFGKPQAIDPNAGRPDSFDYGNYQRLMYDVIALALQTDSTRVVSYMPRMDLSDGTFAFNSRGCPYNYHEMTHHGEDPKLLEWLTKVDVWYAQEWAYFVEKLKGIKEGNETLLDHTLLTWSSSGGTLNAHNNTDLPAMLFGGKALGVTHQGHIAQKDVRLGNLWQTYFDVLRVPVPENFQGGEADGTIKELYSA